MWCRCIPFSYGFLIACDSRLENVLRRSRWPALAVACAATGPLVSWAAREPVGHRLQRPRPARLERPAGTGRWAWIVAIIGFAGSIATSRRHRQRLNDTPPAAAPEPHWRRAARYGNEAVLPFYLLHEPVIVAAAWFIVRWNAPVLAQYAALVAISFAATLALYDLAVRRFRLPGSCWA